MQSGVLPPHSLVVRHLPPLHAAGVHPSTAGHSPFVTHCTHEVPLQCGVPPPHSLAVSQVPLPHAAGVHPSGGRHWELDVHATQPLEAQYGAAPPHAAPPLHVQLPATQRLVSPVHCELDVQVAQPVVSHVSPVPHAGPPLQVHVPMLHVSVVPMQSESVQHCDAGMHVLAPHAFEPVGH
jgi:hypothetical protein